MKQDMRPPTQHVSWRLPGCARCLHISHNITPPLLPCVPIDQLHQPWNVNAHVYWAAVYSTSEDRHFNSIGCLMVTYIGPAAYSTLWDRRLNSIACLNTYICWPSYVLLQASLDIGLSTMLQIVGSFGRKVDSQKQWHYSKTHTSDQA